MRNKRPDTLRDWLAREPWTLTLGSGFFGFFAHFGVVKALLEAKLRPARLTGASSGALIAGCLASGMSIAQIEALLFSLRRQDFWDPAPGLGLLRGERFRQRLREALPLQDFSALAIPLTLSVYNLGERRTELWQEGNLVEAIYASCALPLLFQPLRRNGARYADGGIRDRPALAGVAAGERVLIHHLAAKSPWRRASDPALRPPVRNNAVTLVCAGLSRAGPFRLERGQAAFREAYGAVTALLDAPCLPVICTLVTLSDK